jgi:hypothetical protein
MCEVMKASRYKLETDKQRNCNCPDFYSMLNNNLSKKDVSLANAIRGPQGRDVCFIERGYSWPTPENFHRLMSGFEGSLITVMRDPWSRFKSNYEKDYNECQPRCKFKNAQEYAQIGEHRHFGGTLFSRPNFYVRMLNGLAGDRPGLQINSTHLAAAISVLKRFDIVMFLEQNISQQSEVVKYITSGRVASFPTVTNNKLSRHSSARNNVKPEDLPPDALTHHKEFMKNNAIDYEFYKWAFDYFTSDKHLNKIGMLL